MKKTIKILLFACASLIFNFQFSILNSASAQNFASTHYWSVGLECSTPFFFATYTPGGSNIFVLDGSYTHVVGRNWLLGAGVGIGGAASPRQVYRTEAFDTLATARRNPYIIPVFFRGRYLFDPTRKSGWIAGLDAGYMLGFVGSQAPVLGGEEKVQVFNFYSAFATPSLAYRFGSSSSRMRVTTGAGLNLYFEGREMETAPYDRRWDTHLNFTAYVTFDFGVAPKNN